ncbi:ribonuclease III [Paracoccus sphaerophysae]|uniref:Ribonuclease 3 n=1 Tax=Paracoccus sphaerophysae TaxID=690417 RepID=A0A099FDI3_9RHOB|nr:ribonuclease III [Paracoccus sphaerophysae]KGJ08564.1 ribonuclease [Paracoccus sphaerophysae]
MKLSADLVAFQRRLGHDFADPALLIRALTHGSLSSATRPDNQRLEFLGDRVLGLTIAEALLRADRGATEGQLAPRLNALVRGETCADIARQIGLGEVLKLGRSEMMTGGRRKDALLGDAMEAVIAAVYLDAGFEPARAMILRLWGDRIAGAEAAAFNAKTALQEWAQAQGMAPPRYQIAERSGPDHAPLFRITVTLDDGRQADASGTGTKRSIEQAAAQAMLDLIGEIP